MVSLHLKLSEMTQQCKKQTKHGATAKSEEQVSSNECREEFFFSLLLIGGHGSFLDHQLLGHPKQHHNNTGKNKTENQTKPKVI